MPAPPSATAATASEEAQAGTAMDANMQQVDATSAMPEPA